MWVWIAAAAMAGMLDDCEVTDLGLQCGRSRVMVFDVNQSLVGGLMLEHMPRQFGHLPEEAVAKVLEDVVGREGTLWRVSIEDVGGASVELWGVKLWGPSELGREAGWVAIRGDTRGQSAICLAPSGKRTPIHLAGLVASGEPEQPRQVNREARARCREIVLEVASREASTGD